MTPSQIQSIQAECGTTPDGFWGPLSIAACKRYIRALMPDKGWPQDNVRDLINFYGPPGTESRLVYAPAPVPLYFEGRLVTQIRAHRLVMPTLLEALVAAHEANPRTVEIFDGIFMNRPIRGGTRPSVHAFGAAIDIDAERNLNHVSWPVAASMPFSVIKAFARHGFVSAAVFWGRDAMHFQATSL